jgi:general secretion pathway protein D
LNRFIKRVGWLSAVAILLVVSPICAETQTNSTGGSIAGGTAQPTQGDIDQILAAARQAMAQGNLEKADAMLKRAEAAKPKYPVLHFGDTPARVRRDLDKLIASRPAGQNSAGDRYANTQVAENRTGQVANPFAGQPVNAPAQLPAVAPLPQSMPAELPATLASAPHVNLPESAADAGTREICNAEILSGRRALVVGDVAQAERHLEKAQQCAVTYTDSEDSPARLAQAVAELKQLTAVKDKSASWQYGYARFLTGQGELLFAAGDLENAERAASEAVNLVAASDSQDPAPLGLLSRITKARREQSSADSVVAEQNVRIDQAVAPAAAAVPVDLTLPNFEPQPGTPELATPRLAQLPESPEPLPATETGDTAPPTPNLVPEAMDAFALLQEGEVALRSGDRGQALNLFRLAHTKRDQLDVENQQRLQDHLQMLSSNPLPTPPAGGDSSLIDAASSGHSVIARQLSADIGKRQTEAAKMRETDPKKSLEILNAAAEQINKSELDENTKTQLLRRLSLSIAETDRYIKDHGAEIELEQANKTALEDVERARAVKAQVREKLEVMIKEFNQLRDEQRYAEMEIVAKRIYDMAPDEPVAQQVWDNAKFIRRTMLNRELADRSEAGVIGSFQDTEATKVAALEGSIVDFGFDAKKWDEITKNRKGSTDVDAYRTKIELEIQRKLDTMVLPTYSGMPLSEVMDGLSKLAGINIHLDSRGLGQEGVQPDTPVTLNLGQEVSLKSALKLILDPLHLTYMIKDEVLKITSEQIRDGELETRVYNVADLVIPIPNFVPSSNMGLQGMINDALQNIPFSNGSRQAGPVAMVPSNPAPPGGVMPVNALGQPLGGFGANQQPGTTSVPVGGGPGGLGGAANADFDSLIDLIVSTVEYDTWMENGSGEGEIQPFPTNLSLVVSQTQRVHEQIVDLLEQLRRLQDLQVTIEVRFIRLTDSFFERVGMDFDFNISDDQPDNGLLLNVSGHPSATVGVSSGSGGAAPILTNSDSSLPNFTADIPYRQNNVALPAFGGFAETIGSQFGFAILSDIEAYFLLQAAQGDSRSNVLQAPKVTLFNGQTGVVADTALRPFVISVIPVVGDFAAAQQPVIVVLSEGTLLTVQAVVSDDRKYVRMTLSPFFSQIGDVDTFTFEGSETTSNSSSSSSSEDGDATDESEDEEEEVIRSGTTVQLPTFQVITVNTTVSVPDGGTVLLGGVKRLSEGRNEFGVPLLSKVPYVDRLFRNVGIGRQTDSLMMMVTPHIIIQEEEEERLGLSANE